LPETSKESGESDVQTKVVHRKNDFERLLSESLDDTLTDLFGEKSKQIIYTSLKSKYCIAREKMPERLSDFDLALTEMFGRSSRAIRRVIVKRLYSRMRIEFVERTNYGLLDYVADARLSAQPFVTELSCGGASAQAPAEEEAR
jgi:hypothetical protein